MNLFDVHTHLQFAAFSRDWKETIDRALSAGVWLVNSGTQKATSSRAIEIAENYEEGVYASVGLHPIHAGQSVYDVQELGGEGEGKVVARGEDFDSDFYRELAGRPKVVAIGECGLDFAVWTGRDWSAEEIGAAKEKQKEVFRRQIELSIEIGKPIVVHCRDAYPEMIEIFREFRPRLAANPGIIHFFSGNEKEAGEFLGMNFCFSFGGIVTFAERYAELVGFIPLEKILLETDAPYVAPVPLRGKRNEPAYLVHVARKIAELKKVAVEEVAETTTATARRLFRL